MVAGPEDLAARGLEVEHEVDGGGEELRAHDGPGEDVDGVPVLGDAVTDLAVEAITTPPPPPPDLTAAAFFDVDNTMMMGASIFHFARGLAARKFFTTSDLLGFAWEQLKFRIGGRETSYSTTTGRERSTTFAWKRG